MATCAGTLQNVVPRKECLKQRSADVKVSSMGRRTIRLTSSDFMSSDAMRIVTRTGSRQRGISRKAMSVKAAADLTGIKKQVREEAAAERRWEAQVTEGRVKSLSSKEAGYACELSSHTLLDVRPAYEHDKSWVKNSVWVPAFVQQDGWSPGAVLNKFSNFALGGWWSGSALTKMNERFMPDVVAKIPKSANVIVACQRGLRSLAACEQLYKAGYRNLFWLQGGFDQAEEGDFSREGAQPLKFAGIGGMSEFLGWTDVQRAQAAKEGLSYRIKLFARLAAVVVGADLLFVGTQQLSHFLHH
eukprot:TRINITY_DN23413_c0_g1_i1.p1 TRINITY_DN23413_c0_g1~~TRINITY_DN23413_c0_g1_i1.p1  ORF type:complete len:301 (-),score=49.03 TRINITY_DN23413_c0_g1_i1:1024-1926(-)